MFFIVLRQTDNLVQIGADTEVASTKLKTVCEICTWVPTGIFLWGMGVGVNKIYQVFIVGGVVYLCMHSVKNDAQQLGGLRKDK